MDLTPQDHRDPEEEEKKEQEEEEQWEEEEEEEEEEEGELALWSPDVQVLQLEKGEKGLGFSILDYQVEDLHRAWPPVDPHPGLSPSLLHPALALSPALPLSCSLSFPSTSPFLSLSLSLFLPPSLPPSLLPRGT